LQSKDYKTKNKTTSQSVLSAARILLYSMNTRVTKPFGFS